MKTSRKILILLSSSILLLLIAGLLIVRNDLQAFQQRDASRIKIKEIQVADFSGLDLSGHLMVKIRQGNTINVEMEQDSLRKPRILVQDGILSLKLDSQQIRADTSTLFVKITMPDIRLLKAKRSTVFLHGFASDSVHILLQEGANLEGKNNKFKHSLVETEGKSTIRMQEDEMN